MHLLLFIKRSQFANNCWRTCQSSFHRKIRRKMRMTLQQLELQKMPQAWY